MASSSTETLLFWSKIFAINSAKSSEKFNFFLLFYSVILFGCYIWVLYNQLISIYKDLLLELNYTVLSIQVGTLIFSISSCFISNWCFSKKAMKCFNRMKKFDDNLHKFGFSINHKRIKVIFYLSLLMSSFFLLYVALLEYIRYVEQLKVYKFFYYLSYYLPLGVMYFNSYFIVIFLYFLSLRYSTLTRFLQSIIKSQVFLSDSKIIFVFLKSFNHLINTSNCLIGHFSLKICALFCLTSITVTNNVFLLVKGHFKLFDKWIFINNICLHITEIVVVVLAHYKIHRQVNRVHNLATNIFLKKIGMDVGNYERTDWLLVINKCKLDVQVFGMFTLTPTVLLNVSAWILSYLIIMIQFTPNTEIGTSTWTQHGPTYNIN